MTMSNGGVDATETVENSAVTILPPNATGSLGLYARADSPDDSKLTVNLRHVTMRGKNGANTGIQAIANSSSNATEADVNVRDSVIADLTTDLFSSQANGDVAKISIDNSFYGFTKTSTSGGATITPGTQNLNSATVDPGFVDDRGDTHLRYDSPLIDRGVPGGLLSGESTTDLLGLPRLVDGDGDGTARRDIGALEYQRRPPVVQASAAPSSALPGAPFTFDGSATDPDPGDSVVSLGWSFDDGANAGGGTVQHAFAAPGAHSGTASATDSAGATGTATVGVSVVSASVVDATAPLLGIKGGRVRLSKRGVATITLTCPAAEVSGPCAGALVLDTVRKLRVKPAAKRRRVRLGRATFSVPSGSTRKVNVLLSKRNRLLVARLGLMKVAATADVHDQAGNTAKASRRLTLLPPTRKRS
jgi:hypothetical protein